MFFFYKTLFFSVSAGGPFPVPIPAGWIEASHQIEPELLVSHLLLVLEHNCRSFMESGGDSSEASPSSPSSRSSEIFDKDRHVTFLDMMYQLLPSPYQIQEINRLTLAYFVISGLDILGALDRVFVIPLFCSQESLAIQLYRTYELWVTLSKMNFLLTRCYVLH